MAPDFTRDLFKYVTLDECNLQKDGQKLEEFVQHFNSVLQLAKVKGYTGETKLRYRADIPKSASRLAVRAGHCPRDISDRHFYDGGYAEPGVTKTERNSTGFFKPLLEDKTTGQLSFNASRFVSTCVLKGHVQEVPANSRAVCYCAKCQDPVKAGRLAASLIMATTNSYPQLKVRTFRWNSVASSSRFAPPLFEVVVFSLP